MEVLRALEKHPDPIDLDAAKENWAAALQRCHPDEFRKGGNRVCVPMMSGGEVLGLMILGDRVGGISFSWQDFDLLKCVARPGGRRSAQRPAFPEAAASQGNGGLSNHVGIFCP